MTSRPNDPRPVRLPSSPSVRAFPAAVRPGRPFARRAAPARGGVRRAPGDGLRHTAAPVTLAGADWLASAGPSPHQVHALWAESPGAPMVLPCGTTFDVVGVPALFGRKVLDRLWTTGPGSGPVAVQRGRLLLFASPGTAQRLPALLAWEEWARAMPPLLCHGTGDAVTVPPLYPPAEEEPVPPASRWLVAPEVRHPWLPDAEVLLWACVRVAREAADALDRPVTSTPTF
ncbi:bifunctional DNA primase/polymerase [Streptomyces sp. NPDC002537]